MNQITVERLFQKIGEQHITIVLQQEHIAELQKKVDDFYPKVEPPSPMEVK